ncbi:MAG: NAD/NADP octopine/nopaline dehydrogenase family protein [Planctomycetota bacterium]|nr:NAD/NADP octopine/nopaline dehydrogenase family protein [Planctomycetota bacterium]
MNQRRITVMGGGHGARTVAADMSLAGHAVTLFEYEKFHENVSTIFDTRTIEISGKARTGTARIHRTTHDIPEALEEAELVIIVVPSLVHRICAESLSGHLRDGQHVVLAPGTMGSLEFIAEARKHGGKADMTVSELDTLPYATRIQGPSSVRVYHNLPTFGMGVFPSKRTDEVYDIFKDLYPGVCKYRDVLEAGLSNCNPIIHPLGVLMNAGRIEYSRGEFWYYEEGITPSTARAMETLDDERIAIGKKLGLDLPRQSEALHAVGYGPKGDLWEVLKGSKGLTPIKGPTTVSNRYVTEDIPIGLVCWSQLGEMVGVATPLMRATVELGIAVSGVDYWDTGRTLHRCGIAGMTAEQLCRYAGTGRQ